MPNASIRRFIVESLVCVALAVTVWSAFAQAGPTPIPTPTPDGEIPANEGVCDDLMFATPGLYGLCVAFCEAQDCEPDFSLDDPFEQCTPSSPKVLEAYDKRKGEGDPEMPCVQQTGCPCWSPEELAALPFPGEIEDGTLACIHREGMHILDLWAVVARMGLPFMGVAAFKNERNENPPFIGCEYLQRVVEPFEYRQFVITHDEYATCTADVIASGLERGLACWPEL